ncbi:hypothetical protein Tcan_09988 [Toxocara canis]|uniref:RYYR-CCHC domain-containing protein n=1 Tax=Toxocara canis TaxID=6265 RepID=A0A0B2UW78_TOXCA|nr:hypothetical protein Tcan_09988 [Toxocara canis]
MAPKRNFADPRAVSVLARYKRDLQSVRAVKAELERTLGWETTLQTVWRHLKTYEQAEAMLCRMKREYSITDSRLPRECEMEEDEERQIDIDDVDDDAYFSSTPPKLSRENRIFNERYDEEYYRHPSSPSTPSPPWRRSASVSSEVHTTPSRRLTMSSLVIPEKDNPNFVRVYRQTAKTKDTAYYRCSTCDTISRKTRGDGLSTVGGEEASGGSMEAEEFLKRPRATVKAVHGRVVGNPYPKHHPQCHPISADEQRALEIDRNCRAKVKYGEASPKSAWNTGRRIAETSCSRYEAEGHAAPFPEWKRIRKQYNAWARNGSRDTSSKLADRRRSISKNGDLYCEEQFDDGVSQAEEVIGEKNPVPIQRTLSKRLTMSSIVVPDACGDTVRVYRMGSTSKDGHTSYYRCSKCETLSHKPRITPNGIDEGPFPRARIRTVDGRVVGNAYPTHHPDCRPMSGRIFKAQEIDTGCRYRIKQGLISPRRAWDLGQQIAESESFNDNNDEGIPFPQWDKVKRRYYRLSRGKKARIDDVDQAFFDEDSFDPRSSDDIVSSEASISREVEEREPEMNDQSIRLEAACLERRDERSEQMEQHRSEQSKTDHRVERVVQEFHREQQHIRELEPVVEPESDPELEPELEPETPHLRKRVEHFRCSCKHFYEANLELHEDIVRCLSEMKAMRNEMRQIYAEMRIERGETKSIPMSIGRSMEMLSRLCFVIVNDRRSSLSREDVLNTIKERLACNRHARTRAAP